MVGNTQKALCRSPVSSRCSPLRRQVPEVEADQLSQTDRQLDLGHAIVEAHHVVDVGELRRHFQQSHPLLHVVAVVSGWTTLPGDILIVGDDGPTLAASGEVLALAQAEGLDVADRAHLPAFPLPAVRLCTVLDDLQIVVVSQN